MSVSCRMPPPTSHQGILSVSFREVPWLLKKISQPLKFAVVIRGNFPRADTQKWLASGGNVPKADTRKLLAIGNLRPTPADQLTIRNSSGISKSELALHPAPADPPILDNDQCGGLNLVPFRSDPSGSTSSNMVFLVALNSSEMGV